jgi:hypothetical protein
MCLHRRIGGPPMRASAGAGASAGASAGAGAGESSQTWSFPYTMFTLQTILKSLLLGGGGGGGVKSVKTGCWGDCEKKGGKHFLTFVSATFTNSASGPRPPGKISSC